MKTIKGPAMHVHHNILFEYCYDYDKRVKAIKETKPENEQLVRLKLFRMLTKKAIADLPERIRKADAERGKAGAEWKKADAEWEKAGAEWEKADAEWEKADAEWEKADAEWEKAVAEWEKAGAERKKAVAEWPKTERETWHKKHCGCKEWNGKEIVFNKINQ